jgi:thiamine kinase-like enzyme
MQNRLQHKTEVRGFLQKHFLVNQWRFALPSGTGNETYFAYGDESACFVKLGVQVARYQALDLLGLVPQLLASGYLEDGTSIIVQRHLEARNPSRKDYRLHLEQFASIIDRVHHCSELQGVLPVVPSNRYRDAGMEALNRLQQRWSRLREQVPGLAGFVDESLADLAGQVQSFSGSGLVASHNDICNANWLVTPGGQLYLADLELMSLDDPALDIGATLWWYYPPGLWQRFLETAGCAGDESFRNRMRVRMAMHCLSITLPREDSFDRFDPATYDEALTDFRAMLVGGPNPEIDEE